MTDFGYLDKLAAAIINQHQLPLIPIDRDFHMELDGFVEPKERPRSGKAGHFYTPTDTRKYEARVREEAIKQMRLQKLSIILRPVTVHLTIHDKMPTGKPWWWERLAREGYVFAETGGDLDNKEKAILDAINKVVYKDDKQVVQNYKFRRYDKGAGFKLTVSQAGLNKTDLENLTKSLKAYETNYGAPEG